MTWSGVDARFERTDALVSRGLRLEFLHEHPFTLFERWRGLERHDDGTYHLPEGRPNLPLIYSLEATRPA